MHETFRAGAPRTHIFRGREDVSFRSREIAMDMIGDAVSEQNPRIRSAHARLSASALHQAGLGIADIGILPLDALHIVGEQDKKGHIDLDQRAMNTVAGMIGGEFILAPLSGPESA